MAADETTQAIAPAPAIAASAPRVQLMTETGGPVPLCIECRRVVTLIGSREHCKICLRHKSVAAVHVAIVNNGTDVYAIDLMTKTGTRLNGLAMECEKLADGDVITIGPWEFAVDIKPGEAEEAGGLPADIDATPGGFALEHVVSHRVLQPSRSVCLIGRRKGCDIAISDSRVSRAHALLINYLGFPTIFDLLSRNQTFVNASPASFQVLKNEDVLAIGDSKFRVRLVHAKYDRPPATTPITIVGNDSAEAASGIQLSTEATAAVASADLIDIKATEGSQRWTIVDSLEKATRKKK